jgi:hypothetical protein
MLPHSIGAVEAHSNVNCCKSCADVLTFCDWTGKPINESYCIEMLPPGLFDAPQLFPKAPTASKALDVPIVGQ